MPVIRLKRHPSETFNTFLFVSSNNHMPAVDKARSGLKLIFHLLQIIIILSGVMAFIAIYLTLVRPDTLITLSSTYLLPIIFISGLAVANGLLGFNCLNSQKRMKIFLFITTGTVLMNIQLILAFASNRIVEGRVWWMNDRWNRLTIPQREFLQRKFGCCGLETIEDRVAGVCEFTTPCGAIIKGILYGVRNTAQRILLYMFIVETASMFSLSFLKLIT